MDKRLSKKETEVINAFDTIKNRALKLLQTQKVTNMKFEVEFDTEFPTELKTTVTEWLL